MRPAVRITVKSDYKDLIYFRLEDPDKIVYARIHRRIH
jgi:hypothetical protein